MPRVEASWVPQDQDLSACANTLRSRALCAARWDQLWEKRCVEFLSSENQQCPGSDLMLSLPSIRFCVSLMVCVHLSCFVGTRAASESTEQAPEKDELCVLSFSMLQDAPPMKPRIRKPGFVNMTQK